MTNKSGMGRTDLKVRVELSAIDKRGVDTVNIEANKKASINAVVSTDNIVNGGV